MFLCKVIPNGKTEDDAIDISNYVVSWDWSGDLTQAARKLEFSIAYNTKDKGFKNLDINVGDTAYFYEQKEVKAAGPQEKPKELFRGKIFYKDRNTSNFTYSFVAYDDLIYLAKSKTTLKFSKISVSKVIEQVVNEFGLKMDTKNSVTIDVVVDFVADNMSCTEIIQKAFKLAYASNQKKYHLFMQEGLLHVVEQSKQVENYTATDKENVVSTEHSESIEDMISTVKIVNAEGVEVGRVSNDDDLKKYGKIQDVYKVNKKQDTQTAAKALLKRIAYKSTLSGVGNAACIAGMAIAVQEEQLKGLFTIKSDRHSIAGGTHSMELDLEFLKEIKDDKEAAK